MGEGASHDISIHALREEGDTKSTHFVDIPGIFLSTPSARRATTTRIMKSQWISYFYPRPPRGGRQRDDLALLAVYRFLSTPSARRATTIISAQYGFEAISIHALREEGDTGDDECGPH